MNIVSSVDEVRARVKAWRRQGLSVGLVPTMGYLHEGHRSLIVRAVQENDRVVVSDFVNPTQFGPGEDLASYPRDIEADARLCEAAGAHLVFHPAPEDMYAPDFCTWVDMRSLSETLCGRTRPIHFRGVCTVVSKLFHIVAPDRAYFGQKDAQQLAIIRRMVRDLNFDIEIVGCPIVREADGLALSSRNTRLNAEQRQQALQISKTLFDSKEYARTHTLEETRRYVENRIDNAEGLRLEYFEVVDGNTLQTVTQWEDSAYIVGCITVFCGEVRLIDNIKYKE